jgi:hypothetical protein
MEVEPVAVSNVYNLVFWLIIEYKSMLHLIMIMLLDPELDRLTKFSVSLLWVKEETCKDTIGYIGKKQGFFMMQSQILFLDVVSCDDLVFMDDSSYSDDTMGDSRHYYAPVLIKKKDTFC